MVKNREINGTEEIGLVTPIPDLCPKWCPYATMSQAAFEGKFKRADAIFSKSYFFERFIRHLILCISFK